MRIATNHVQQLANICNLEYIPKLDAHIKTCKEENLENQGVINMLEDRSSELKAITSAILSDDFFMEDLTGQ